ncbi:hypothetical protein BKI52_04870 [marine bacterium AO1-C]|nr:hypothetical protein BKI52_04870 [marine bacterium AO1-C]
MSPNLAPIVLFAYNRPWHLQQTVNALLKNPLAQESILYIFSDAAKDENSQALVTQVRSYIHKITGFKKVFIAEKAKNAGLAPSVIEGVTKVLEKHQKAIVLEDDMICSKDFLKFMNDCLDFYQNQQEIFSISGYTYPINIPTDYNDDVFIFPRASSWGWGTWLNRWEKADWEMEDYANFMKNKTAQKVFNQGGEDLTPMLIKQQKQRISSWAVRWSYTHYKHSGYCLFPIQSKIHNIGTDNSGVHTPNTQKFDTMLSHENLKLTLNLTPHSKIYQHLQKFFQLSTIRKIINYLTLR